MKIKSDIFSRKLKSLPSRFFPSQKDAETLRMFHTHRPAEPFKPKPAEPDPNDIKRKSNSSQGPLSSCRRIFDKRVLGRLRDQVSHPLLTFSSLLFLSLSFSLSNAFKDTSASSLPGIRRLLAINAPPFHASLCGRFSPRCSAFIVTRVAIHATPLFLTRKNFY